MGLKKLLCSGRITDTGSLNILSKGFCYSTGVTYPTLESSTYADSGTWVVVEDVDINGNLSATITGLTEGTYYYINSYAQNIEGVAYSNSYSTKYVRTLGIIDFPTMTISMTNNGIPKNVFEIGTSNYIIVSGETTKNEESLFIGGKLIQISSPPPPGSSTILSWSGYQPTYNTSTSSVVVNFNPMAADQQSLTMTQTSSYDCGNPLYTITASNTVDAVFPFLWVLKDSYQNSSSYFTPSAGTNYFYSEASAVQNVTQPTNGKLIEKKILPSNVKEFWMTPYDNNHKYLNFGAPASYGNYQYSLDNINWVPFPSNILTTNVSTGPYGSSYGIVNQWTGLYRVLRYTFTISVIPRTFYIKYA